MIAFGFSDGHDFSRVQTTENGNINKFNLMWKIRANVRLVKHEYMTKRYINDLVHFFVNIYFDEIFPTKKIQRPVITGHLCLNIGKQS